MQIDSFTRKYRFLSNFSPAPVEYDGMLFPTVEHAFQAAKTLDLDIREQIRKLGTPGAAKRMGKKVQLRPDWTEAKIGVMHELLVKKFSDPHLRNLLIKTGSAELIEGNTWHDAYWGVCDGIGQNHLGRLLMQVRLSGIHALPEPLTPEEKLFYLGVAQPE